MKAYMTGIKLAIKLADMSSPEAAGLISGGVAGGALGGLAGHELAKHIGEMTRHNVAGIPIPFSGLGEQLFGRPQGVMAGELLGGLVGTAAGGSLGKNLGSFYNSSHAMQGGRIDPRLQQYLLSRGI